MEAMLQMETSKTKKQIENPRSIKAKRYAQNFSSSNRVEALNNSDIDTLISYGNLLRQERVSEQDDEVRIKMIERIQEVFGRSMQFKSQQSRFKFS